MIETIIDNELLNLIKCSDGFWLWDKSAQMNLAMQAKTEQAALLAAIGYYQKRCKQLQEELRSAVSDLVIIANTIEHRREDN